MSSAVYSDLLLCREAGCGATVRSYHHPNGWQVRVEHGDNPEHSRMFRVQVGKGLTNFIDEEGVRVIDWLNLIHARAEVNPDA